MTADSTIFEAEELKAVKAEIQARIDHLSDPVDDELRAILAVELLEKVEASTQPDEVVIDHLTEIYEITRDFKFPSEAVEDEAMFLVHYQYVVAKDFLDSVVEDGFDVACEHFPRQTDSGDSVFTVQEQAAHALKLIQDQKIEGAPPGKTNGIIEGVISRFIATLENVPEDTKKIIGDAYRARLLDSSDPQDVLRRRLSRYAQPDGTISIPEEEHLDRAIHLLGVRRDHAVATLQLIASDRDLSCGDHHVVYAGGVESEGNRIFTPQRIAQGSLEEISKLRLERIHLI